jgi:hypothetical protein
VWKCAYGRKVCTSTDTPTHTHTVQRARVSTGLKCASCLWKCIRKAFFFLLSSWTDALLFRSISSKTRVPRLYVYVCVSVSVCVRVCVCVCMSDLESVINGYSCLYTCASLRICCVHYPPTLKNTHIHKCTETHTHTNTHTHRCVSSSACTSVCSSYMRFTAPSIGSTLMPCEGMVRNPVGSGGLYRNWCMCV